MMHVDNSRPSGPDKTPPATLPLRNDRGFTLIESIAVILLLAILAVIVVTRSNGFGDEAAVAGASEIVKNHLRYAQTRAMSSNVAWGINFAASPYTLRDATSVTAPLPGDAPGGVTVSASLNPLMFDPRWGSPGAVTVTVTVSKGTVSRDITVTKNTGFIP